MQHLFDCLRSTAAKTNIPKHTESQNLDHKKYSVDPCQWNKLLDIELLGGGGGG